MTERDRDRLVALMKTQKTPAPALVTNALYRGQKRRTMYQKVSQIGNSDYAPIGARNESS